MLSLPPSLEPYRQSLESHLRPAVILKSKKGTTQPWQSNLCGLPYWPKNENLPKDSEGQVMFLVGQINFSEMPSLPDFPTQGLLQFFLSDIPGKAFNMNEPSVQTDLKVIFVPEPIRDPAQLRTWEEYKAVTATLKNKGGNFFDNPNRLKSCSLKFEKIQMLPLRGDKTCEEITTPIMRDRQAFNDYFNLTDYGSWIGGYGRVRHDDPRPDLKLNQSLLHLDSDESSNLEWGDFGQANWYIEKDKLLAKDFSCVAFCESS